MPYHKDQIKAFVDNWLNTARSPTPPNAQPGNRGYLLPPEFDSQQLLPGRPIIIANDPELAFVAPFKNLSGNHPLVILVHEFDDIRSPISRHPECPVYWLVVNRDNEPAFNCYQRAFDEIFSINNAPALRCIIAADMLLTPNKKIAIIDSREILRDTVLKLKMELNWHRYTTDLPSVLGKPKRLLPGEFWFFRFLETESKAAYFPGLLFHYLWEYNQIKFNLLQSAYQCFIVLHLYQSRTKINDLVNIFQATPRVAELKYHLLSNTESPEKYDFRGNYFCYEIDWQIKWPDSDIFLQLKNLLASYRPALLIIDINASLSENTDLQQLTQAAQKDGTMVWFCCHEGRTPSPSFPFVAARNIDVFAGTDEDNVTHFKLKMRAFNGGQPYLKQISLPLLTIEVDSKYSERVDKIKELTVRGCSEKEIAEELNITIYTLRQIKRQYKIRKNQPLKKKRRQGMDQKIMQMHNKMQKTIFYGDQKGSASKQDKTPLGKFLSLFSGRQYPPSKGEIKEIAKKLKVAPSYVNKRLEILMERELEKQRKHNQENDIESAASPPSQASQT
jgi:hypothetical protein